MGRAAQVEAAGGQAAPAARRTPDLATLERVHAALLGQLGGTLPSAPVPVLGPAGYMARRTPGRHRRNAR
jgi:hypothetical protein